MPHDCPVLRMGVGFGPSPPPTPPSEPVSSLHRAKQRQKVPPAARLSRGPQGTGGPAAGCRLAPGKQCLWHEAGHSGVLPPIDKVMHLEKQESVGEQESPTRQD